MLVHLEAPAILDAYVVRPVTFDEDLIKICEVVDLPVGWNAVPAPISMQELGDAWVARGESAVLGVPSAVIQSELNYLLNLNHADFTKIKIGVEQPHRFDPRLLKTV